MVNHPTDDKHLCFINDYRHPPFRRSELDMIGLSIGWFMNTFYPFSWWFNGQALVKSSWHTHLLLQTSVQSEIPGDYLFVSIFNNLSQYEYTILNRKISTINLGSQEKIKNKKKRCKTSSKHDEYLKVLFQVIITFVGARSWEKSCLYVEVP